MPNRHSPSRLAMRVLCTLLGFSEAAAGLAVAKPRGDSLAPQSITPSKDVTPIWSPKASPVPKDSAAPTKIRARDVITTTTTTVYPPFPNAKASPTSDKPPTTVQTFVAGNDTILVLPPASETSSGPSALALPTAFPPADPAQHAKDVAKLAEIITPSVVGSTGLTVAVGWGVWKYLGEKAWAATKVEAKAEAEAAFEVVKEQTADVMRLARAARPEELERLSRTLNFDVDEYMADVERLETGLLSDSVSNGITPPFLTGAKAEKILEVLNSHIQTLDPAPYDEPAEESPPNEDTPSDEDTPGTKDKPSIKDKAGTKDKPDTQDENGNNDKPGTKDTPEETPATEDSPDDEPPDDEPPDPKPSDKVPEQPESVDPPPIDNVDKEAPPLAAIFPYDLLDPVNDLKTDEAGNIVSFVGIPFGELELGAVGLEDVASQYAKIIRDRKAWEKAEKEAKDRKNRDALWDLLRSDPRAKKSLLKAITGKGPPVVRLSPPLLEGRSGGAQ